MFPLDVLPHGKIIGMRGARFSYNTKSSNIMNPIVIRNTFHSHSEDIKNENESGPKT